MRFSSKSLLFSLALFPWLAMAATTEDLIDKLDSIEVNLKNPTYSDGVLETSEGGVIYAKGIRIQAQKIRYTRQLTQESKIARVSAEGDILFEYEGQFFTGTKLEYDFIQKTGELHQGRTCEGVWFAGGDKIELSPDGNFTIYNAFLTTCESQDNAWCVRSKCISASKDHQITASHVQIRLFDIPVISLPSFKTSVGFVSDPPIRYKLLWDKGLGPRATVRYRVFSKNDFNLFARLDYRLEKGPGAAVETEYLPKAKKTSFITRSYVAHDKVVYDESSFHRYRLQGLFTHTSVDDKTDTYLSYDKFSDLKMISDFPDSDFEVTTQQRTIFLMRHQEDTVLSSLLIEPRLNPFESLNQKLPLVQAGIRPFTLGSSGILSENSVSAGYLNYIYASDLLNSHPSLRETHSSRLAMQNRFYRPFTSSFFHFTPSVGALSSLYSNNQRGVSVGQAVLTYGGTLHASLYKNLPKYKHTIEPYCYYEGLSNPTIPLDKHYTFTIQDGLYQINSLKIGVRNTFSSKTPSFFSPTCFIDLYTYHFFFSDTFTKTFPKAYALAAWRNLSYLIEGHTCWNFQESVLDFCNLLTEYTVNENAAFAVEFRHRSRFDFRKADHENFILDMARPISELVDSPLSDGRNTFLGRIQVRLSPKWSCHLSSHIGWGRGSEPSYTTFKIDTLALLSCKWQLKFSYAHTTNDDRFSMQMQLNK